MYKIYMLTYDIVEDEEVKREMGRRKIKPNYDVLVELLQDMTQEDKERFVQKLFGVDSPEEAAQKLLGVSSPEEALRKLSTSSHQIS